MPKDALHLDRRARDLQLTDAAAGAPDQLIDTKTLVRWLGVSVQWAEIARSKGYGPPYIRLSATRVRYRRDAVIAWLKEREHLSTAAYSSDWNKPPGRPLGSTLVDGKVVPPAHNPAVRILKVQLKPRAQ